ncbi:NUDIX domain-containing protein [Cognatiyoonia sp. IB215182]|uniref:NUDIX domain-containing protein n=1 Tax=Cognatiyoonia sp. IB215182 TaxID=3097353 RepID=UPI002A0ACF1E|nr:NUDIX domain-containing protein [Cognatiyoonia sp. IB215182]MDX8352610.1 NUDIX domain-containing protein [Cognatiyoonia sp. IB215182]
MDTTQPHHGAKVALFLGDQLVSILRDDLPHISYPNLWDLPGGGREGDETTFETLSRELEEELGLVLPHAAVLWENSFQSLTAPEKWNAFFVAQMPADTVNDIVFGDEGQRWALFEMDAFIALPDRVPSYDVRLAKWVAETGGLNL